LNLAQANALLEQLKETTRYRNWLLVCVAIMHTHLHVIVGVPDDPDPEKILGDIKAYGARRLNREWSKPDSDTWWTTGGSKRKLPDKFSIETAVNYVRNQPNPLLIWTREEGLVALKERTGEPQ
jgi:REP element-mobilizing transposase RayT